MKIVFLHGLGQRAADWDRRLRRKGLPKPRGGQTAGKISS